MSTNRTISIIKKIKDSEFATLRIKDTYSEPIDIDCIFKEYEPPSFFLVFPPDTFPADLDAGKKCTVSIKSEEDPVVFTTVITRQQGDRTLEMKAVDTVDPISLREYFRVFFQTTITASYEPSHLDSKEKAWTMKGDSVDLSGTGVLVIFPKEPLNKHNIFLDFDLPATGKSVHCIARIVRTKRIRKSRYQVALHFEHITRKHRDLIITACLQEQRKQLRERMESSNS
ncbi:MAG: hypothetical protein CSA26_08355 [Desulfobacterales bacterium]|nr:MAG: hypothetical protein CSA26_08355 [Desulfobacterales bacterium]